jgi:sugar phosphate isomerase/epimerase
MAVDLGPRLAHVHLADGTGTARDEHLVPGRGGQPCAEFLETLATQGYSGNVVVEVGTRKLSEDQRDIDLTEALAFARLHLAAAAPSLEAT